jgi:hypothetical protein
LWLSALVPTVPTVKHAEMSLSTLTPETLQNAKGKAAVDTIRSMICWETICNLPDDFYKRSGNYHHEWSYYILNYTYNRYVYIYYIQYIIDLSPDQVAIITGATSGVGLEAARVLAANGAATW